MVSFSIITPTYNRAHTLHRVFKSLINQTFRDFEWIIIDDGSLDITLDIVNSFIKSSPFFNIKYHYTKNGGKHRAINLALNYAHSLFTIVADSDDEFTSNALEIFFNAWKMNGNSKTCGMKCYVKTIRGKIFSKNINSTYKIVDFYEYKLIENKYPGEGWFCILTSVMKENKFPEILNEPFIPESVVWNKILMKYELIYVAQPLRVYYENEPDNLSNSIQGLKRFIASPNGYILYLIDKFDFINGVSIIKRLKCLTNISRFYLHLLKQKKIRRFSIPLHITVLCAFIFPIGFAFFVRDLFKVSRK